MRGLIARIIAGWALRADLDAGFRQQREKRLARDGSRRNRRLEHARPKVEQLRQEMAAQRVVF